MYVCKLCLPHFIESLTVTTKKGRCFIFIYINGIGLISFFNKFDDVGFQFSLWSCFFYRFYVSLLKHIKVWSLSAKCLIYVYV